MPQIYETINLYNREHGIFPYRYIGSDQNDNPLYFGSSAQLQRDIKLHGIEHFEKRVLIYFDDIDNKELRKTESTILKENDVKNSIEFYNKTDMYAPGGGVKGMKHSKPKIVSEAWRSSRRGWKPTEETRKLWSKQRKGKYPGAETRNKMSKKSSGKNNPNALKWEVIDPQGTKHVVVGLRKWCIDNGYNYGTVYNQRAGFLLTKFGEGKGGPGYVKK